MRSLYLALAVTCSLLTLAPTAWAADYYVKEGGTGSGTSWADPFGNPEQALAIAQPGDHILVHEGDYVPTTCGTGRNLTFCVPTGVWMHGGFRTSVLWDIPDGSFQKTVLSGDLGLAGIKTDNSYNVVTLNGNGAGLSNLVIIDGFKITLGYADGVGTDGEGGALRAFNSELLLENAILRDNFAGSGGGFHFDGGTGATKAMLEVRITRVRDNQARVAGAGGYLRNTDGSAIGNVKFRDNGGAVVSGGGLYLGPAVGALAVTQNIFHDNTAGTGGAIYIENPATTGSGASIWVNNTVAYNSATTTGAGMYIEDHTGGSLDPEVHNAIHYFNPELANNENIVLASSASVTVTFSDIGLPTGTWTGINNNINLDPLFRNGAARNLRLLSLGAQAAISPCLDVGDDNRVPLDRLDIDDDKDFGELLPWDFDRLTDPDTGTESVRWLDVPNAPDGLLGDTSVPPNNPVNVVVDMGAYENYGPPDTGPGGPGE
jgi:hypothetical protein